MSVITLPSLMVKGPIGSETATLKLSLDIQPLIGL